MIQAKIQGHGKYMNLLNQGSIIYKHPVNI